MTTTVDDSGYETLNQTQSDITRLAADAFETHVLTKESDERWKCRRADGSWMHGFFVLVVPGALIVYGDTGDGIFRHSGNGLPWLRGAVKSPSYLLSKLQNRKKKFYPGDAIAWAAESVREETFDRANQLLADATRLAKYGELHTHTWCELISEYGLGPDEYSIGVRR